MCDVKSKSTWIIILIVLNAFISLSISTLMFILTYPGDECLLFVSVRGQALIYGNPSGCHYISYGHCFVICFAIFLLGFIFSSRKTGYSARKSRPSLSNRTLQGSIMERSRYDIGITFPRIYSIKTITMGSLLFIFTLLTAIVCLSGYQISCNELQYEARNQLYGRTTLGPPILSLNIACYSLFRDTDFHHRFHYDHYEYSGLFYGQNRGYKHGRVHQTRKAHEHLLPVEIALEGSLAGTFISWFIWLVTVILMVLLRRNYTSIRRREMAESLENTHIYGDDRLDMRQLPSSYEGQVVDHGYMTSVHNFPTNFVDNGRAPSPYASQPIATKNYQQDQQIEYIHSPQSSQVVPGPVFPSQETSQSSITTPQYLVDAVGVQYMQMSNGLLVPVSAQSSVIPPSITSVPSQRIVTETGTKVPPNRTASGASTLEAKESKDFRAQLEQLSISQDAGFKCSQI